MMDWDALGGAVPVVLWILFLELKKRKQQRARAIAAGEESANRPGRGKDGFKRDYEPIEPA